MNIGSLQRDSVDRLEDAGLLQGSGSEDSKRVQMGSPETKQVVNPGEGREVRGTPWFEELIQGSELGRIQRRGQTSLDGHTQVEWEISEYESREGEVPVASAGKRKLVSLDPGENLERRSG